MFDQESLDLSAALGDALQPAGWMLAAAESCTGGLVAGLVTAVAGSSAWFDRGFVTYTNAAKVAELGVREDTLAAHGAVSEQTAGEMAAGALKAARAQMAVSTTGIAGPGGATPGKPVGMVCFGWAWTTPEGPRVRTATHLLAGDRAAVRMQAVRIALRGVLEARALAADPLQNE
ncbi:CinA family protein [Pigmentiphaga sp. H8]|uniref:CinA family protein n=1 Tax=Pigmentiphaga sp. H8 TaxID=2488560 RepID=UPI000F590B23|nr:CinA family protein [Pigmentiphaga sp. H8]AZG10392.1 CinA family protein [Pigmentiphaga sp. H8]